MGVVSMPPEQQEKLEAEAGCLSGQGDGSVVLM